MKKICFYFQVHQPFRLKEYTFFDLGTDDYWNDKQNQEILDRIADNCYLPTNQLLLSLIQKHKGKFHIAFAISGVAIEQFEKYRPDVLASFQALVQTGCVELIAETYYHSLAALYNKEEFEYQVKKQEETFQRVFDYQPKTFRNTELIYSNEIAKLVEDLGYKTVLTDGLTWNLQKRTANQLFSARNANLNILLKNGHLSDDIAFRFGDEDWTEHPLTAQKYLDWCLVEEGEIINLFMDYETFGEHKSAYSGIFTFLEEWVSLSIETEKLAFVSPQQIVQSHQTTEEYHAPRPISWADTSKDISTWTANSMQREALSKLYDLEREIGGRKDLLETWRRLQTSDMFYYMSTKGGADGEVHSYFRPYNSAYDSYIFFMNALSDVKNRL